VRRGPAGPCPFSRNLIAGCQARRGGDANAIFSVASLFVFDSRGVPNLFFPQPREASSSLAVRLPPHCLLEGKKKKKRKAKRLSSLQMVAEDALHRFATNDEKSLIGLVFHHSFVKRPRRIVRCLGPTSSPSQANPPTPIRLARILVPSPRIGRFCKGRARRTGEGSRGQNDGTSWAAIGARPQIL